MKKIYLFVFIMSLSSLVKAQFSTELQNVFQEILDETSFFTNAKGLSVAVISEDNQWAAAAGFHARDSMLTTDSAFGMGSVSKTIISATVLRLMEDGLLSLSDPISLYLDSMTNIPPEVTILQLLNHTSGIYNFSDHPDDIVEYYLENLSELVTPEFILENFLDDPNFAPGTEYSYSNSNYLLLGLIIEEISGQAYYLEAREQFDFDVNYPSFTLPPYESDLTELAHLFADTSSIAGTNPTVDVVELGYIVNSVFSGSGAAGAYASTPSDLAQWAYDLYSGNILEAATMDSLFTITLPTSTYGLGVDFFLAEPCGHFIGHNGETFYTASAYYNPENDIAVSVQCNEVGQLVTDQLAVDLACAYYEYSSITDTDDLSSKESIDIFPNPFSDAFTVKYGSQNINEVKVALYNELGLKVDEWFLGKQATSEHLIQLDTDVPNGMYVLKIQMGDNMYSKRIIKM